MKLFAYKRIKKEFSVCGFHSPCKNRKKVEEDATAVAQGIIPRYADLNFNYNSFQQAQMHTQSENSRDEQARKKKANNF